MKWEVFQFPYGNYIFGIGAVVLAAILLGLFAAKNHKQYTIGHLLAGLWLIAVGVFTLTSLINSGFAVINFFAESGSIKEQGVVQANSWLNAMRYFFPVIAVAFGTRFVGNWIVAEKPNANVKDKNCTCKP